MSPIPQSNHLLNAQPPPVPPFQWNQLTPTQQTQLAHLLAQLLKPHLNANQIQRRERPHEQPA